MSMVADARSSLGAIGRPRARRGEEALRIGVAVETRYLAQREPTALAAALERRGHFVELLDPDAASCFQPDAVPHLLGFDAVVARGHSPALLRLLDCAERLGIPTVNRPAAIASVRDRREVAGTLEAAGLPTPPTRAAPIAELAEKVDASCFPLVLKAVDGDSGRDVVLVRSRRELIDLCWAEPLALAQPLVPGDGHDLKIYAAGDSVWAVRKPSLLCHAGWRSAAPHPVQVTAEMRFLAGRCRAVFGLDLFGLDCVDTGAALVVIAVNDFPDYAGHPQADERMADLVVGRVRGPAAIASSGS